MLSKRQTLCPPSYYQSANSFMVTHALDIVTQQIRVY